MIVVKVDSISAYSPNQIANMKENLSDSRRQRIDCYTGKHSALSILASFGIEEKLTMICGYKRSEIEYTYLESGKPLINGDYYISMSHSGDNVCYGVSDHSIGVDIEQIRELTSDKIMNSRFFTEDEKIWVNYNHVNFLYLWTFKEAICKCAEIPLFYVCKNVIYPEIYKENWDDMEIKDQLFILGGGMEGQLLLKGNRYSYNQYIEDNCIVCIVERL